MGLRATPAVRAGHAHGARVLSPPRKKSAQVERATLLPVQLTACRRAEPIRISLSNDVLIEVPTGPPETPVNSAVPGALTV